MKNLSNGFRESIDNNIWQWSDGDTRDIVDTGQFRDTQSLTVSGYSAQFYWPVPYAEVIYFGRSDVDYYIPRNWIKYTLLSAYPLEFFAYNPFWNSAELPG